MGVYFYVADPGRVAERLKALVSKTSRVKALVGSNPTPSAGWSAWAFGNQQPGFPELLNPEFSLFTACWRGARVADSARLEIA